MSISTLHQAALDYISRGWKIFPCYPNSKLPATPNGFKDASSDREQIDAWWAQADYNLAMCPDDQYLAVVDWDAHKGCPAPELPDTYTVDTPNGGKHFYFIGSAPSTVGTLGCGIDTRGQGGYVLLPPSTVNDRPYTISKNNNFASLPASIETQLASRPQQIETNVTDLDLPVNLERAAHRLSDLRSRGDVAISGMGGNNRTYQLAAELLRDFGLTPAAALRLIMAPSGWNGACKPPWSEGELETILEHAHSYGQNGAGAYAVAPIEEVFKDANFDIDVKPNKFRIYAGADMMKLPEPKWIVPELIPEGGIGILSAPKGSFKTFLSMDLGLGIASSKDTFAGPALTNGTTYYGAHEGFDVIGKVHYPAWCNYHTLDPAEDNGFYLMRGPKIAFGDAEPFAQAIDRQVQKTGRRPSLIVLDTYSRCMVGLDENDPRDVNKFVDFAYSLIQNWPGSSLLVPAHKGKDASRGTRGSSAFEYASDFVIDLDRKDRSNLVEVRVRFQRAGKEREAPWSLMGKSVDNSLVFETVAGGDISALQRVVNIFDYRNITHVLRKMGATSDNIAVSTHALATQLTPRETNDSEEVYSAKRRATEQALIRLARSKLKSLTFGNGKMLSWVVPNWPDQEEQS